MHSPPFPLNAIISLTLFTLLCQTKRLNILLYYIIYSIIILLTHYGGYFMKIVGLIAEYNPFHNGHRYHIEQAKKITGADYVIVIMSGNFVQRGTPAIMPKRMRCEAALRAGASLVIELPDSYATASAEAFALGAVSILDKLGCVDSICFGSECGSIEDLQLISKILADEPIEYKHSLQHYLKTGNSYPLARQKAMADYLNSDIIASILSEPNNILGIEYLKALYKLNSKIKPHTITRVSSSYHDEELRENFSSATAIRNIIKNNEINKMIGQVPEESIDLFKTYHQIRYPIYANDFSLLLKYRLLNETKQSLCQYADISEELANRIINQRNDYLDFEQFCDILKTKEITYSRISRALLHVLLNIKQSDLNPIKYARLLGFRKDSTSVLSKINDNSAIPLVGKLVGIDDPMILQDIYVSNLYESVVTDKFKTSYINEYEQSLVLFK